MLKRAHPLGRAYQIKLILRRSVLFGILCNPEGFPLFWVEVLRLLWSYGRPGVTACGAFLNGCFFADCFFLVSLSVIICRYITILYYLNNVEDGGETAFPVADMKDFNETVSVIDQYRISVDRKSNLDLTATLKRSHWLSCFPVWNLYSHESLEARQELSLLEKHLISCVAHSLRQFVASAQWLVKPSTDPL